MGSKVKPRIINAAITLFGRFGLYGVTTLELAKEARVIEGSLYRLFLTKEKLYDEAVESVVRGSTDALAQFVLTLYSDERKNQDLASLMGAAVRCWYSSFTQDGARLLLQAAVSDKKRSAHALSPNEKITEILVTMLDRELKDAKKGKSKFDTRTAVESLILTLFQFKITGLHASSKEEMESVERYLQHWLQGLPSSTA
jgi:AcrR family transcriptional regulator